MKIYAISDLHVDSGDNLNWVNALSLQQYQSDMIIIAGDVCTRLELLAETLTLFKKRFANVIYTPGNHELWVNKKAFETSKKKLHDILKLCGDIGVVTDSLETVDDGNSILIVPIFSWYTQPEQGQDSLYVEQLGSDRTEEMWADNYYVDWDDPVAEKHPVEYMMQLNKKDTHEEKHRNLVITFSHFLPRREVMFYPGHNTLYSRNQGFNFSRVAGSLRIDKLLRQHHSDCHIYGHQHFNKVHHIDGVTYVSACLGYTHERMGRERSGLNMGPLLIADKGKLLI